MLARFQLNRPNRVAMEQTITAFKTGNSCLDLVEADTAASSGPYGIEPIRFEERKNVYIGVQQTDILFAKSADHYVKSLIQRGAEKKWVIRHSTIKDLIALLAGGRFVRLNKFYVVNCDHFSRVDRNDKILYLNDGFPIPVPHSISQYMLASLIRNGNT
jgi:DNA-binding LytR/AlgR family response regulator